MTKKSLTTAGQSSLSSAPVKKTTAKKTTLPATQGSAPPDSAKPSAPKKTSPAKAKTSATKTPATKTPVKAVSKTASTASAKAADNKKTYSPNPATQIEKTNGSTVDNAKADISQAAAKTSAAPAVKKPASGAKKAVSATKKTTPSRQTAKATVSDDAVSSRLAVKDVTPGNTSSENLVAAQTVDKKTTVSTLPSSAPSARDTAKIVTAGADATTKEAETIVPEIKTSPAEVVEGAPAASATEKKGVPPKRNSGSSPKASAKGAASEKKEAVSAVLPAAESTAQVSSEDSGGEAPSDDKELSGASEDGQPSGRRRSRSRRGRGRRGAGSTEKSNGTDSEQEVAPVAEAEAEAEAESSLSEAGKLSRRKMLVSVQPGEQVEVVISEEGQVQEYYIEMLQQAKTKGNIYKAIIHNVDPNLQAAFISYGANKNGFLQIDEVHPEYYCVPHEPAKGRKYPPIQKVLKVGQELLVQVVKEPTGTKGAFLTTYLSLPGRFLVLTPGREQIGVSRKVDHDEERARLREMLEGLSPGPGLGVIVRTVSMGTNKNNLQKDLQSLKKKWKDVRQRGTTEKAPCLIYQEMDLTTRAVRDYLTDHVAEIWLDDEKTSLSVAEIALDLFPRKKNLVRLHKENTSLFERFNIQRQLDQIFSREVQLPSGGRLVVDPTEALTAIDINSGRSSGKNNFEDMAYRTNLEAAKMIPLQLRLRDIGGQVVIDFIEMRDKTHWREIEKTLRTGMKIDRARYDIGKIGPFGMLELVRQRLGSSAISVSMEVCPCCRGLGVRHNMEWQSQQALKEILRKLRGLQGEDEFIYEADPSLAMHLLNHKRQRLSEMEQETGITLIIQPKG